MQKIFVLTAIVLSVFLMSCAKQVHQSPPKIAVSKLSDSYRQWILQEDSCAEITSFYGLPVDSVIVKMPDFDGLLLTGGEDVFPAYYGKIDDTARCGWINHYRDSLEMAMISWALSNDMPIIGVCRGAQILNVAMGGSLIVDIPSDFDTTVVHRQKEYDKCFHRVSLDTTSLLYALAGSAQGTANSNHHQAVDRLADGLKISAHTDDGLPEAIERLKPDGKPFLIGVQWHPERLDPENPLSGPLMTDFLEEARGFSLSKKH